MGGEHSILHSAGMCGTLENTGQIVNNLRAWSPLSHTFRVLLGCSDDLADMEVLCRPCDRGA